ncbi:MAG TPA: polysaccharide biosynthesis C-terminal domain-containing protein [Thermoplasmata archaeon]|nr:polysaccharide biosynthesis C-terminal domain-containing protein [Thermoplasmata archaeon]
MAAGTERGGAVPTEAPRPKGRSLGVNSSVVFSISIVIQLVGYIPTFFLARGLGLSVAGQTLFGTIQTFLLLATSVTNLADVRIGAAYTFFVSRGEPARDATSTYFTIRILMVAGAGLALWLLAPSFGVAASSAWPIFAVWMVLPILWSTSTVYQNLWVSLGDSARGQYPQLVESLVRAALLSYFALGFLHATGHGTATPTATLWAMTYAYVAGAVASGLFSLPSILAQRGRIRRATAARFFRWSWPLMGSLVLLYLSGNLISFVVIALLSKAAFNIFNAANAFRVLALALPAAIAVPLFPHISSLHKEEAFQMIRSRTWQTLRFTAILVVPGVLALAVYRVNILNILYSASYLGGSTALAILAVSAIPAALSQIIGTTMTSIGRTRLELYITSLQVACLAAVSALLVRPPSGLPGFPGGTGLASLLPAGLLPATAATFTGLNGAAVAVLVSSLAALALNAYFLYTLLGVRIQLTPIATIVLSSLASFLAISQLNDLLPINRYYQLAAGVVLGFAVYLVVLAAVGELTKEDVATVGRSLGLPEGFARYFGRLCWRAESRPVNPIPPRGAAGLVPLEAEWAGAGIGPEDPSPPPPPAP